MSGIGKTDIKLELLLNNQPIDPKMGIYEGYIQEAINEVTLIELYTVSQNDYNEAALRDEFLNNNITVKLSGTVDGERHCSRYDGVVFKIEKKDNNQLGPQVFLYHLTIRPELWKLALSNNCASFSNKTAIEVIEEVLQANNFQKNIKYESAYINPQSYPTHPQILQNEISNLDFLQRLLQDAGVNFYFDCPIIGNSGRPKKDTERLRLVDSSAFFKSVYPHAIVVNPNAGLSDQLHINRFDSTLRAVPGSLASASSFAPGSTQVHESSQTLHGDTNISFREFVPNGLDSDFTRLSGRILKERFETNVETYNGQSNHFCLRAGQKFTISPHAVHSDKVIIVTSVRHMLSQPIQTALSQGTGYPFYTNEFEGTPQNAPIRPQTYKTNACARSTTTRNQVLSDLVKNINRTVIDKLGVDLELDVGTYKYIDTSSVNTMLRTLDYLTQTLESCKSQGVQLGTIIEDASSINKEEMTCKVKSAQNTTITCKVGTGWLVPKGGLTLLPRAGMQVYYTLLAGSTNNGVMLAYRPSNDVSGQNPNGSTSIHSLQAGGMPSYKKAPPAVVKDHQYKAGNRNFLALKGENGVAQIAVIDGDKASVTINADKNLHTHVKENHTAFCNKDYLHGVAGNFLEDIKGDKNTGIHGNHNRSIAQDQTLTVMGNQNQHIEKNKEITVNGHKTETIQKGRTLVIKGKSTTKVEQEWFEMTFGAGTKANFSALGNINIGGSIDYFGGVIASVRTAGDITFSKSIKVAFEKDNTFSFGEKSKSTTVQETWSVNAGKHITAFATEDIDLKSNRNTSIVSSGNTDVKTQGYFRVASKKSTFVESQKNIEIESKKSINLKVKGAALELYNGNFQYKGKLVRLG